MTLREAQAMLLLWGACEDPEVRARAALLVPELAEWGVPPTTARRWRLVVRNVCGVAITDEDVVCREADLPAHIAALRARLELLPADATVRVVEL